ncbi:MAG: DEAD/DEAH box helicase [Prevotellaceae bacterium]|nr:DEAD/DEAH box helicase [Prevotellaceae bacterium]
MKFEELDLNDNVLDALYDMRFDECTPVQENCIPPILDKRDVLGVAQTGTGKTAAYLLPILSRLADGGFPKDAVNCIIMSPTRELAQQIDQAMQGFSYYLPDVSSVAVYGGNDGNRYDQEMKSMRLGADVIIATPGRLISHISMGNIDLSKVSFFVLDEADRMLDMGFSEDIMKIASGLPESCQTIMFSATMPKDIETMAQKLLKNPVEIKLAVSKPAEKINQSAYICYETQKLKIIDDIFKAGDLKRVIIFSGSKMKVKQINQALQRLKINCGEMHSDLDQAQRDEMMYKFKSGQLDVLVATDIVSRGIDIDDITMVINYDVPHDAEDYVHRIGRTARADRDGVAITFVNEDDMYAFHQIEKFLEREITKNPLPEGCGEGPEYTTTKRPGKTNARNRRRNDRNQTAHRDSKQHEHGRRNNRNTRGNNGKSEAQNAANTEKRQDNRQQQRQQGQNNNRTNETTDSAQHNTRTPNNNHKNRRQNNRQGNTEGRGQEQERNNNTERRNNYNRRNNNRRPQRQGEDRQRRNSSSPKAAATTTPVTNPESGIARLIKRPLRWLKALGKK